MRKDHTDREFLSHFFEQLKKEHHRCYFPKEKCIKKPCHSHSIQSRKILNTLAHNGHVIMPRTTIDRHDQLKTDLIRIGTAKATTFTGLCSRHDNELFQLIDDYEIDFDNKEQLFLLSYRSVLKGLHAAERAAVDMEATYSKALELNMIKSPFDYRVTATLEFLIGAKQFTEYKYIYDQILINKKWDDIKHIHFVLCPQNPTIAVSSVFSSDILVDARKCPAELCLNIFPVGDKTHILCSYLSSHEPQIQKIISHLSFADKYFLRYEISKLVLSKCENFVLSPKVLGTFSTKQVEKIKDFILKSKLTPELDIDDPSLCLFYD